MSQRVGHPSTGETRDIKPRRRKSWRIPLRFSLRLFLFLILFMGGGLAWMVRAARVQRDAVAQLRRAGFHVNYDWGRDDRDRFYEGKRQFGEQELLLDWQPGKPWAPTRLVDALGDDYFGHVISIEYGRLPLGPSEECNAALSQLGKLNRLESLSLVGSPVTDAGLGHLEGLTHLRDLRLSCPDAGLAHIANLSGLRSLKLYGNNTDDGLVHLQGLKGL